MNLKKTLAMFGYTTESAAQELARAGYGDAKTLQNALERGDKSALSFIPQAAQQAQRENPDLMNRMQNLFTNQKQ